ncbi:unnamed protein product [Caenorhabditis auriculariae]|uniref:Uncharacterized protein n=1 Tax=Caenorhabditis auriculariae TaxID=2777116 RepID=A0A8S1HLQ8_9PELO|nr:unnamed protein product [Caenorhabditis auriculariae]
MFLLKASVFVVLLLVAFSSADRDDSAEYNSNSNRGNRLLTSYPYNNGYNSNGYNSNGNRAGSSYGYRDYNSQYGNTGYNSAYGNSGYNGGYNSNQPQYRGQQYYADRYDNSREYGK